MKAITGGGGWKSTTFQWDVLKEDILVWCVTRNPFHARQCRLPAPPLTRAQLHPSPGPSSHSRECRNQQGDCSVLTRLARRSVAILTTKSAPRELNGTMPTSAGAQLVVGTTPYSLPSYQAGTRELTHL